MSSPTDPGSLGGDSSGSGSSGSSSSARDTSGAGSSASGSSRSADRAARRRWLWPRILIVAASLLVLALAAGALYAFSINRSVLNNLNRSDSLPQDTPTAPGESPRPTKQATGTLNYLLLGSDSRDDGNAGNGRSDTIVLVHLNQARDQAYVISFPRDMWVSVPGHGKNKINAAFALGGPPLTVQTVERLVNDRIDHVLLVDFDGFVELTDALGGVTVTNRTAFSSHGHRYPKGEITIGGEEALWFVRERHALPRGDFDRAENQRKVIKAIVTKGLSREVISNPARFTRFLSGLAQHVTADSSLSDDELRSTALSLRLTGSDLVLLQAPISGVGTSADGQSIDVVDAAQLAELSRALRTDTMAAYAKKYPEG